ncbi:DUF1552 domain-containing protein [Bdellovibrio reynosensis]|uniref:DUF1552 domain-containing protein n=1 Tax=Bdellovibrio reynosensis TaxID=2835041 RepID=A0ABY4C8Q4_9BACT|nr:DUF1552 domain-containing protein [Bdellovibrio reynosensis]UOF01372.1 DUF1552 domain-containing protein [Bdellovibrio reynosensis]
MKYNKMSRRMFLQGAGQMLPIPFLVSLLPRELWAQSTSGAAVKRYIGVSSNFDYGRHSNWFPTMNRPALTLSPGNGDRDVYYAPLSSYLTSSTANLSRVFGNHLNSNINSINIIRGLDLSTRIAHGNGHIFGNFQANDNHEANSSQCSAIRTIDQVLRDSAKFNTSGKDVAVLGNDGRSWRRDSSGNIVRANLVANNLRGTYNYLFNNGSLPETTGTSQTTAAHPRAASMNGIMEDYTRVRNSRQISAGDRTALSNAMDLLSDIQRGLQGTTTQAGGTCSHRSMNNLSSTGIYMMNEAQMTTFANMIVAAIMCDVTRIFMWNGWVNEDLFDTHPSEDFHQGHSHIPFSTVNGQLNWQYMGDVQRSFVRGFIAPLVNGLAGAVDPSNDQSYLYNSLVHFTLEASQVHSPNYQPCMLAGNAGGIIGLSFRLHGSHASKSVVCRFV